MSDSNIWALSRNYSLPYNQQRITCLALHFRTGFSWPIYSIIPLKFVDEFEFSILLTNSNSCIYVVTFSTCLTSRFMYQEAFLSSWIFKWSLSIASGNKCIVKIQSSSFGPYPSSSRFFKIHQNATFRKQALLPKSSVLVYYPDQQMHNIYINNVIYIYIYIYIYIS